MLQLTAARAWWWLSYVGLCNNSWKAYVRIPGISWWWLSYMGLCNNSWKAYVRIPGNSIATK